MNDTATKGALAKKLAAILKEVGKVPKSGHNAFHKYDYVTENDLVYAVRDRLAAASIFVFTSVIAQSHEIIEDKDGKRSLLTVVTTEHTFVDGDSGESFSVRSQGQGSDNGDKGGYKAITGAMKYFIYKCFMIPTGDDPEGDENTDKRGEPSSTSRSPATESRGSTDDGGGTRTQRAAATGTGTAGVPRDVSEKLREQFRGNKWTTVEIHFGKQKGTQLAALESKSLEWWINEWQPKEYKGKFDPKDLNLRAALDVANDEWK